MSKIYHSNYKGIESICLENGDMQAVFLPSQGAKLCSYCNRRTGYEYIYQGKGKGYKTGKYGQSFLEGECAGVDEMFPNIDAFYYDAYPWEGTYFPDHGELWALPWDAQEDKGSLTMAVYGVKLPYKLTKTATMDLYGKLSMEYKLENLSVFEINFVWAAHMMFHAEEHCRFEFEESLSKAYTTMSDSGLIGTYGDTFSYPLLKDSKGAVYDIRENRGNQVSDYQKFYFAKKLKDHQGWGRIIYPKQGSLTISFPADKVPYLGAVQWEGGELDLRCMMLEPCTGAFDRPDIARLHSMDSVLGPREIREWYLNIEVNETEGEK